MGASERGLKVRGVLARVASSPHPQVKKVVKFVGQIEKPERRS